MELSTCHQEPIVRMCGTRSCLSDPFFVLLLQCAMIWFAWAMALAVSVWHLDFKNDVCHTGFAKSLGTKSSVRALLQGNFPGGSFLEEA